VGRITVSTVVVLLGTAGLAIAGSPADITSDLSPDRAEEVRAALERGGILDDRDAVIGSIEIARVGVEGPILEGVDDLTIRRAVGHFPGSSLPFEVGNMALAAHRTTHFRGLRDVRIGDAVTIRTGLGSIDYVVEETWIVDPEEVWVLDPTDEPALTLVTCYPFDHPGTAPQRFVVRARAVLN
jgi:LPXTG-site transpeptidase (sortase) family protein